MVRTLTCSVFSIQFFHDWAGFIGDWLGEGWGGATKNDGSIWTLTYLIRNNIFNLSHAIVEVVGSLFLCCCCCRCWLLSLLVVVLDCHANK